MKIAIEARSLTQKGGGVKTYVENLVKEMSVRKDADTYVIRSDSASGKTNSRIKNISIPLHGEALLGWWLNYQVPKTLKQFKPDVVHFTKADVPLRKVYPTVVTIYDVIPILYPETQKLSRRWYWPRALRRSAEHSDAIITISEASKRDIMRLLGVEEKKVTVTPLAVDTERFRPKDDSIGMGAMLRKYKITKPYILFVGTKDRRKNLAALVRAFDKVFREVPHNLVLGGGRALKDDGIGTIIKNSPAKEKINDTGFVDDADLPYLYEGADLLVWPSVYEGWGLPPLEAMASGTPVIVSNGGSLPEMVGQAGEVVSYEAESLKERLMEEGYDDRLADRIRTVLGSEERRNEMVSLGLERAGNTSWLEVAQRTRDVYEQVKEK